MNLFTDKSVRLSKFQRKIALKSVQTHQEKDYFSFFKLYFAERITFSISTLITKSTFTVNIHQRSEFIYTTADIYKHTHLSSVSTICSILRFKMEGIDIQVIDHGHFEYVERHSRNIYSRCWPNMIYFFLYFKLDVSHIL